MLPVHCGRKECFLGLLLGRQDKLYRSMSNFGVRRLQRIEQFRRIYNELTNSNDYISSITVMQKPSFLRWRTENQTRVSMGSLKGMGVVPLAHLDNRVNRFLLNNAASHSIICFCIQFICIISSFIPQCFMYELGHYARWPTSLIITVAT